MSSHCACLLLSCLLFSYVLCDVYMCARVKCSLMSCPLHLVIGMHLVPDLLSSDTQHEQLSQSKIYTNASHFVPFRHPVPPASYSSSPPVSVAIVSGSGGGRGLDRAMDMSLSRMYYAQRHGLAYQHLVSEAYAAYFGTSYLDVSAPVARLRLVSCVVRARSDLVSDGDVLFQCMRSRR